MSQTAKRRWRPVLRCCFLAAAVTLVLPLVSWASGAVVVPAVSPFVAVCSVIALRSFSVVTLIGLPVLLLALFRRRWFCRNACPLGVLTERMGRLRRGGRSGVRRWPPIGTWIVLITLAGACFGYPLLLWLDPMGLFASYFALCWQPASLAGLIAGLGVPIVLFSSALWPRVWCRKLCPLGATQELLALPRQLLLRSQFSKEAPSTGTGRRFRRRSVLSAGLGAVALGVGAAWGFFAVRRTSASKLRPLRPPGAADESQFTGLCIRCGNCIRACPEGVLRPAPIDDGLAGFLAPVVSFEWGYYCREACNLCTQVCPSGAIARLSLQQKQKTPIGLAEVNPETCSAYIAYCSLCVGLCPYAAIEEQYHPDTQQTTLYVDPSKCPGCGACVTVCPTTPKSIVVRPLPS